MNETIKRAHSISSLVFLASLAIFLFVGEQHKNEALHEEAKRLFQMAQIVVKFRHSNDGVVYGDSQHPTTWSRRSLDGGGGKDAIEMASYYTLEDVFPDLKALPIPIPPAKLTGGSEPGYRIDTIADLWAAWGDLAIETDNDAKSGRSALRRQRFCDWKLMKVCEDKEKKGSTAFWRLFPLLRNRYDEIYDKPLLAVALPILRNPVDHPLEIPGGFKIRSGYFSFCLALTIISAYLLLHLIRLRDADPSELVAGREHFFGLWKGWLPLTSTVVGGSLLPVYVYREVISAVGWGSAGLEVQAVAIVGGCFSLAIGYYLVMLNRQANSADGGKSH